MPSIYTEISTDSNKRGGKNDCSVKAVAIVCNVSYEQAYEKLSMLGRCQGRGINPSLLSQAVRSFGFTLLNAPEFRDRLDLKTTRAFQQFLEEYAKHPLTQHTYLIKSHQHITAVKDGRVQDWADNRLKRIQHVYLVAPQALVEA